MQQTEMNQKQLIQAEGPKWKSRLKDLQNDAVFFHQPNRDRGKTENRGSGKNMKGVQNQNVLSWAGAKLIENVSDAKLNRIGGIISSHQATGFFLKLRQVS